MSPNFELIHGLLVHVRRAVHGELLDSGRKRDRTGNLGAGALGGLDDVRRAFVKHAVIVSAVKPLPGSVAERYVEPLKRKAPPFTPSAYCVVPLTVANPAPPRIESVVLSLN